MPPRKGAARAFPYFEGAYVALTVVRMDLGGVGRVYLHQACMQGGSAKGAALHGEALAYLRVWVGDIGDAVQKSAKIEARAAHEHGQAAFGKGLAYGKFRHFGPLAGGYFFLAFEPAVELVRAGGLFFLRRLGRYDGEVPIDLPRIRIDDSHGQAGTFQYGGKVERGGRLAGTRRPDKAEQFGKGSHANLGQPWSSLQRPGNIRSYSCRATLRAGRRPCAGEG